MPIETAHTVDEEAIVFVNAEDLKKGDYIFPWDNVMNAAGGTPYKVLTVPTPVANNPFLAIRLQYLGESLLTFVYSTKVGNKERLCIID